MEKWAERYTWATSCSITALCFLFTLAIITPLLNSGDDAYLMYTLGGGYGEKPTELLNYNHIWHPAIGWICKSLFSTLPGINWYTVLLLLFHYAGCCCILYILVKRGRPVVSVVLFSFLFLFIETRQLLSLNFTGSAFTAAAGGICLLLHQLQQREKGYGNIILSMVLLVMADLLRLQIAWLVILLSGAVAIVLLHRRQFIYWCLLSIFCAGVLWALNKQQEQYYKNNIPGWEQQEKFRQALFYSYNRQLVNTIKPGVFADSTEQEFFFSAFLYDSTRFTTAHVQEISHKITRNRSIANNEDRAGLYWFFVEMRAYILLFAAVILLFLLQGKRKEILRWLLSVLAFAAVHSYLFVFLKITMPIHLGLLLCLYLALILHVNKNDRLLISKKTVSFFPIVLLIVASAWMSIRLYKENSGNKLRYKKFICAMEELGRAPDKLFVATDDAFPISYFPIWVTPAQYPATNLLYKDRLITHTYLQTLRRYSIHSLNGALIKDPRVYLLGRKLPVLETSPDSAKLYGPLPGYQCLELWQLKPVP
jgi:hypothetical protein